MTPDSKRVFFLGSHPALSAAEVAAWAQRNGLAPRWDLSRLPAALFGDGDFPSPDALQPVFGGTMMIGTLRATLDHWPTPEDLTTHVPEILQPRQGKRVIALSALVVPSNLSGWTAVQPNRLERDGLDRDLPARVKRLSMELKKAIGMKATRVVFPPARRPDLSTAQLLHNRLPRDGTAIFLLVAKGRIDLVTIDTIQDIAAYARRDRGRPHADPGTGMLPPKLAQMLLNLSLAPPRGTVWDPFCGVGTIPMEALLMGLHMAASDISPKQVERTKENLEWMRRGAPLRAPAREGAEALPYKLFSHDIAKGSPALEPGSIDAIVTEGSLGPARTRPPLPREAEAIFRDTQKRIEHLLAFGKAGLRTSGTVLLAVPAFRVGKRVLHFPLADLRLKGYAREPLAPTAWDHPLFREAHGRGTLLYGRPDAVVLREIVRWRRK